MQLCTLLQKSKQATDFPMLCYYYGNVLILFWNLENFQIILLFGCLSEKCAQNKTGWNKPVYWSRSLFRPYLSQILLVYSPYKAILYIFPSTYIVEKRWYFFLLQKLNACSYSFPAIINSRFWHYVDCFVIVRFDFNSIWKKYIYELITSAERIFFRIVFQWYFSLDFLKDILKQGHCEFSSEFSILRIVSISFQFILRIAHVPFWHTIECFILLVIKCW